MCEHGSIVHYGGGIFSLSISLTVEDRRVVTRVESEVFPVQTTKDTWILHSRYRGSGTYHVSLYCWVQYTGAGCTATVLQCLQPGTGSSTYKYAGQGTCLNQGACQLYHGHLNMVWVLRINAICG